MLYSWREICVNARAAEGVDRRRRITTAEGNEILGHLSGKSWKFWEITQTTAESLQSSIALPAHSCFVKLCCEERFNFWWCDASCKTCGFLQTSAREGNLAFKGYLPAATVRNRSIAQPPVMWFSYWKLRSVTENPTQNTAGHTPVSKMEQRINVNLLNERNAEVFLNSCFWCQHSSRPASPLHLRLSRTCIRKKHSGENENPSSAVLLTRAVPFAHLAGLAFSLGCFCSPSGTRAFRPFTCGMLKRSNERRPARGTEVHQETRNRWRPDLVVGKVFPTDVASKRERK